MANRFGQKLDGASFHCSNRHRDIGVSADEGDRATHIRARKRGVKTEPIASRQHDIENKASRSTPEARPPQENSAVGDYGAHRHHVRDGMLEEPRVLGLPQGASGPFRKRRNHCLARTGCDGHASAVAQRTVYRFSTLRTAAVSARTRRRRSTSSIKDMPYEGMISLSLGSQPAGVNSSEKHFCRTLIAM